MKILVVDTNIIIHILKSSSLVPSINSFLSNDDYMPIISSVTKGELMSFAAQRKWGEKKVTLLNQFLENIAFVDVSFSDEQLQQAYSTIDAFSKRKIADNNGNLLNGSAKKMGKNDLWIAATALSLNAPLMTTDGDFEHLHNLFINIIKP